MAAALRLVVDPAALDVVSPAGAGVVVLVGGAERLCCI